MLSHPSWVVLRVCVLVFVQCLSPSVPDRCWHPGGQDGHRWGRKKAGDFERQQVECESLCQVLNTLIQKGGPPEVGVRRDRGLLRAEQPNSRTILSLQRSSWAVQSLSGGTSVRSTSLQTQTAVYPLCEVLSGWIEVVNGTQVSGPGCVSPAKGAVFVFSW